MLYVLPCQDGARGVQRDVQSIDLESAVSPCPSGHARLAVESKKHNRLQLWS